MCNYIICCPPSSRLLDYQPRGCKDFDVRLTYRRASGYSGQFEICSNNIWRRTCRNSNFNQATATAACNQLFNFTNPTMALITPVAEVLSETGPVYDVALFCGLSDRNLSSCPSEPAEEVCDPVDQPAVNCYSKSSHTCTNSRLSSFRKVIAV